MEHISKKNSLETAKNRLDISGLTYVGNTKYVYDRILDKQTSDVFVNYIPLVETDEGYILRYKNLMRQYYWLINKFIPSCSYDKLCMRNGEKTWIHYENACDALRKYLAFNFYDNNSLIASISVASGNTATPFTPSKIGYNFSGWTTENGGNEFFDFNTPIGENTSVYTKYVIRQIELIFALNNGEAPRSVVVDYGTTKDEILQILVDEGIVPEKEGYTFAEWYPNITTATKNATYDATYTQDIYIIRFFNIIDAEHVLDYYDNQPINEGDTTEYRLIKTETHALHDQSTYYTTCPSYQHFECIEEDGYTWWVDSGGTPISASTFLDVTNSILDVYPKLTKKKYTVSFLDWDNSVIETGQTVEYLSGATAPGNPSREHYTFTGWDRPYSSITNDTIIHATYIGEDINVIYKLPDIEGVLTVYSSVTTTYGLTAPTVAPPSLETYPPEDFGLFGGWYVDSAYTTPYDYTDLLEADTVIYGKWKTEMEVTFYNWDGTLITGDTETGFANPVYVGYGEDVPSEALALIEANILAMPGHEYLGWNKSTTGITNDVKITATFDATQMCIVRFINSIDESVISSTIIPAGGTILVSDYPSAPDVEHMTFSRWDGDTSKIYSDLDVYAIYEYSDVPVRFVDYYNNEIGTKTFKYGQYGSTPSYSLGNVEVMGYNGNEDYIKSTLQFNGAYCLVRDEFDTETGCSIPEETIITDIDNTFIAQYDEIATAVTTCNIRFYNYDSAYWFTDTVLYGTVVDSAYTQNVLDIFASEGYIPDLSAQTFYAWVDEDENEYVIGRNDLVVNRDVKLRAKYKMISYRVQFYVQSNPTYYPDVIDMPIQSLETEAIKNTPINRPDCSNVPERIHFETFCEGLNNRWYTDSACTNEWTFKQDVQMQPVSNPDIVTEDMILYGKYIGIEYTLTYNTNGGSSITQETYRYPMSTVRPADPTKQDSTFIGWYIDNDTFVNEFTFGQPLTGNVTIYAKWFDVPEENIILYNATADLSQYMPDMGSAHILRTHCTWDMMTGNGILLYDAPIETFNIGVLNRSSDVTVNTEIKRNLRTINIPSQVTDVIAGQFEDCRYLTAINMRENNGSYYSYDGVLYGDRSRYGTTYDAVVCYPQAKRDETFKLGDISLVLSYCFANCKNLKNITMSRVVESLNDNAFLNCVNLKEIRCAGEIPPSISSDDVFDGVDIENCKLYIPCESYNSYAEHDIWGEFDIQCFGTVIYLNDNSKLVIEDDVLTRQAVDAALDGVSRSDIISIEIGNNVTSIHAGYFFSNTGVFQDCSNLTSVTFGDSIEVIGDAAFARCYSLTNITIPDNVTHIQTTAFATCTGLTNVEFGSGLIGISDSAFGGCTSLETLYIPYNVQALGDNVFYNCTSLNSITCDRITPPTIGNGVFDNTSDCPIYVPCESVEDYKTATNWSTYESRFQCRQQGTILYLNDSSTVVIPDNILTQALISDVYSGTVVACEIGNNVTEIGDYAFYRCKSLTSITIPNSVTNIGNDAFALCNSLTSITIPNSVTSIGDEAFRNCSSLTSVTIGNSVTSIGYRVFYGCSSLTSITIPNSVTSIGSNAFGYCSSLTSVTIPNSVTSIGDDSFAVCNSLTSITIPNSVTSIGKRAFYNCPKLTSVTIGNSVTSIGDSAFYKCTSLNSITCDRITPPTLGIQVFDYTNNCPIYVPCESVNTYKTAANWIRYKSRIQCHQQGTILYLNDSSTVVIPDNVLTKELISDVYSGTVVACEIGDNVTEIGNYAFDGCSSLTSVTIPNSVTSIGNYAFGYCTSLTSITIPNSVTSIGYSAFEHCNGLTSVTIPNSVTSIGESAFSGCKSLTSVTISNSVTSIGYSAFQHCKSLTSVTIPNSVTSIGDYAFLDCSSLASINVDSNNPNYSSVDGVLFNEDKTTLIQYPIGNTRSEYTIPNSVTSIGYSAFSGCKSLTSVIIPNSVTRIGGSAFWYCSSLTSVTIPNSVTSIGGSAFYGCSGLDEIVCESTTPPTLDMQAFNNTSGCPIYVPCESVNTYKTAANWIRYESRIQCHQQGTILYLNDSSTIVIPDNILTHALISGVYSGTVVSCEIGDNVTEIGERAFYGCSSLSSVTIPNSVTSIGSLAFYNCSSIASPVYNAHCFAYMPTSYSGAYAIPEGIKQIAGGAFYRCSGLTSVTIPNSVTSIEDYAFLRCSSLISITIPDGVTSIGAQVFYECSSLTSVTIGNSITSIGNDAFHGCSSLNSVTIPDSVTNIEDTAFYGCISLEEIVCKAPTPPTLGGTFVFDRTNNCPIYVPSQSVDTYKIAENWSEYADRIEAKPLSPSD